MPFIPVYTRCVGETVLVYKKGAFVAGQLSIVIKAGKDAERMLRSRLPLTEDEKQALVIQVETGRIFERKLEAHREKMEL